MNCCPLHDHMSNSSYAVFPTGLRSGIDLRDPAARLPGGQFRVGSDEKIHPKDGEGPSRLVRIKPFAMDATAVSFARFAAFVTSTGYVTEAEQIGWSYVFAGLMAKGADGTLGVSGAEWWRKIEGAHWYCPEGPGSDIDSRADHPVVHVSWNDAQAFAKWAGGRLPSEAEWEYAAAGGEQRRFPWGDREPNDEDFFPCNIWQGRFPDINLARDGYAGTAPAQSFEPNRFGLFNMVGNTWEWCADAFRNRSTSRAAREVNRDALLRGLRVIKGGSYLCHRSYCYRYRIAARRGNEPHDATGHLGFRLAYD